MQGQKACICITAFAIHQTMNTNESLSPLMLMRESPARLSATRDYFTVLMVLGDYVMTKSTKSCSVHLNYTPGEQNMAWNNCIIEGKRCV
jgi:hypothetical protein